MIISIYHSIYWGTANFISKSICNYHTRRKNHDL